MARSQKTWEIVLSLDTERDVSRTDISIPVFLRRLRHLRPRLQKVSFDYLVAVRGFDQRRCRTTCTVYLDEPAASTYPSGRIDWTFQDIRFSDRWNPQPPLIENYTHDTSISFCWLGEDQPRCTAEDHEAIMQKAIGDAFRRSTVIPARVHRLQIYDRWTPADILCALRHFASRSPPVTLPILDAVELSFPFETDALAEFLGSSLIADCRLQQLHLDFVPDEYLAQYPIRSMHLAEVMPLIANLPAHVVDVAIGCINAPDGPYQVPAHDSPGRTIRRRVMIAHTHRTSPASDINRAYFISRFVARDSEICITDHVESGGVEYGPCIAALHR